MLTIPIGIGGVLYPPNTFHADVVLDSKFMHLAPNADDIWFKAMSLLNNIECKKTSDSRSFNSRFLEIPGSQASALHYSNLFGKENDKQIASVFETYEIGKFFLETLNEKNGNQRAIATLYVRLQE
ncbi:MAG: hypothetical protein IPG06_17725 [Haliea sp.]|nr:hypothetical protein [Haliea sp.]